jgi:hypothetical protein
VTSTDKLVDVNDDALDALDANDVLQPSRA